MTQESLFAIVLGAYCAWLVNWVMARRAERFVRAEQAKYEPTPDPDCEWCGGSGAIEGTNESLPVACYCTVEFRQKDTQ